MSLLLMALVLGQKHWHHLLVFSEAILDCLSVVVLVPGLLGELVFPKHFCSPKVHNKFITLCYKKECLELPDALPYNKAQFSKIIVLAL